MPLCADVCPTGALQLTADFAPETEVIGVAVLNTETCIAYRSSFCAFCHDVCIQVRGEENAATAPKPHQVPAATLAMRQTTRAKGHDCASCGACHAKRNGKFDSRHAVLGGAVLTTAVFGFPVFCLVCPVGLAHKQHEGHGHHDADDRRVI